MTRLDFTGLIVSRLCHDLAGPVSAVANGAELLADESDVDLRSEFAAIIGQSAAALAARLRFYRLLCGASAVADLAAAEAREALHDYLATNARVTLDWLLKEDQLARTAGRLLLALAVVGADSLERGGSVTINDLPHGWLIRSSGPRVLLADSVRGALCGTSYSTADSRAALAYLAAALGEALTATIVIEESGAGLDLVVRTE